jgi:hypothetical protein
MLSERRSEIPVRLSFLNHVLSELDKEASMTVPAFAKVTVNNCDEISQSFLRAR